MSEYIVHIVGKLRSPLTVEYQNLELPSFTVAIDKDIVSAVPHPNVQFDADMAQKRLQDEISPFLLFFEAELENQPLTLDVTDLIYHSHKTGIRTIPTTSALSRPQPTKDLLDLKVRLIRTDATYRDLLELYNEAKAAPNPRPAGTKMKERLNKRFHGYLTALSSLELPENGFAFVTENQSQYRGDRHANYNIGEVPDQMEPSKRLEILTLLKDIIQRYERYLLKTI